MDKKREQWLKVSNRLLSGTLALLGFSACGSNGGDIPLEYGMPHANYEIKGNVTDEAGDKLAGMRVIAKTLIGSRPNDPYLNDTIATDAKGAFLFDKKGTTSEGRYRVVCEDPNGVYKSDSTEVKMEPKGRDGWYQGSDSKEVNFELKKKDAQ